MLLDLIFWPYEHPLGFFLGAFSEIDLDLFNQGSDFRRRYFEG